VEGAVSKLLDTIEAALAAADKHDADAFQSAPREFWDMLASAQELPEELRARIIIAANRRTGDPSERYVDIPTQCIIRRVGTPSR